MLEIELIKRLKVNLKDYDYQKDIQNRLVIAHFSAFDLEVLEEIIYNPLKISLNKLVNSLSTTEEKLLSTVSKLQDVDLLTLEADTITVNKDMRKYYEFQLYKFDDNFKSDIEFLQNLLKKVPIHVLPVWYSIPRSSNSILSSIIDKFFKTPQLYQRYLLEIQESDDIFSKILAEVLNSPNQKVTAKQICEKFDLDKNEFEECMLLLEFCFACFLSYDKEDDEWIEVVTPLYELKEHIDHLCKTKITKKIDETKVTTLRDDDFAFMKDIETLLSSIQKKPIPDKLHKEKTAEILNLDTSDENHLNYAKRIFAKLTLIRFIDEKQGKWHFSSNASEWLDMNYENKALHYYRHPLNQLITYQGSSELCTEKNIREAEKSIKRVLTDGWVDFEDFIKGVTVSIGEQSCLKLECMGKNWSYKLPEYSQDEIDLIYASIFESLFEAGMVSVGWQDNKHVFKVTKFGKSLFEF